MPSLPMLMLLLTHRLDREEGEVSIEYGVLVVFLALAIIAGAGFMSGGINNWFQAIAAFLSRQLP